LVEVEPASDCDEARRRQRNRPTFSRRAAIRAQL
jgi:hypothetical protein